MNATIDTFSKPAICEFCQISYGFSAADRRSIIVLVVLTGIALILCYVGVLWYAIRTRFIPEEKLPIIPEIIYANQTFDNDEEQYGDLEMNIPNMVNQTTAEPAVLIIEEQSERF